MTLGLCEDAMLHVSQAAVLTPLCRQPLQLHGSAANPWGDGASGRGTLPNPGAQQQAPLCEKLLLPQERHLHTVSLGHAFHIGHRKTCLRHTVNSFLSVFLLATQCSGYDTDRN